jgi:hypothetical protein
MNSLIFISFLFCAISDGLLLDTLTKAPVTSSFFLTDTHVNMLNVCEFLVEGFGVDFKAKSPTRPRAETVEGSRGHSTGRKRK